MEAYFETILSPNQCGFRKGFSAQHCLISLIENGKKVSIMGALLEL